MLATIGIFLPSFVFVALLTRVVTAMRASELFDNVLDGVNAFAIALIAGVSVRLATDAVVDPLTALVAAAAGGVLWRTKLNSAWLIGAGATIGIAHTLLT